MKYILGIDLGQKMGVCKLYQNDMIETRLYDIGSDYIVRLHGVRRIINNHIDSNCLGVCIEKPFGRFKGIDVMLGMFAVACMTCDDAMVPWSHAHLMKVKKHATGKGNAKKADMQAAAKTRWGVMLSEDEADASHVAAYARDNDLFA